MDPTSLKTEFEKQIKDADSKILAAEKQLKMLQDYKMKIVGGLETLELLNPKTEVSEQATSEVPAE